MEKISVQDFVVKSKKFGFNVKKYITKKYLPIVEKDVAIESVIDLVFSNYDSETKIETEVELNQNAIAVDIFKKLEIIKQYTDIEVGEKATDEYDLLVESGLYEKIFKAIGKDVVEFENYFYDKYTTKFEFLKSEKKSALDELLSEITSVVKGYKETMNFEQISSLLPQLAKLGENFNQKEMVSQIIGSQPNQPQDHKKPAKPTKSRSKKVVELPKSTEIENVGDGVDSTKAVE